MAKNMNNEKMKVVLLVLYSRQRHFEYTTKALDLLTLE